MWKYIVSFVLILIGTFIIKSIDFNKRFIFYITRLDKTNENIKEKLLKKYELLIKKIHLLKNKKKLKEDDYDEFLNINKKEIKVKELDNIITIYEDKLNKIIQDNEKLIKDNAIKKNINEIEKTTVSINGIKKYYNKICENYNKYLNKFPSKYVGKMKKYQQRELYQLNEDKLKVLEN